MDIVSTLMETKKHQTFTVVKALLGKLTDYPIISHSIFSTQPWCLSDSLSVGSIPTPINVLLFSGDFHLIPPYYILHADYFFT